MRQTTLRAFVTIVLVIAGGRSQSALAQQSAAVDPLETRVTISYQNAPAAVVIDALAKAGGLSASIGDPRDLRFVTITLTNVKLRTALDAVCDGASCSWSLRPGWQRLSSNDPRLIRLLTVTPVGRDYARSLEGMVSLTLQDTPVVFVFVALAEALHVRMVLPTNLPDKRINFDIKNAQATDVLKLLCEIAACSWDFNPNGSILRILSNP